LTVRVGCSGWQYDDWRHNAFYPEMLPARRWLEHYASVFDTVEVNATFYRLAKAPAVAGWVEATPPSFAFAVKGSRYLTHMKRLTDMADGLRNFYAPLAPLTDAGRLGPVLWQLPPNFQRDDDRLAAALDALPEGRHAFEFRHATWFAPEVYALLRAHDIALVAAHHKRADLPTDVVTASWVYVRFHWGARGRRGNYSPTELDAWAGRIRDWSRSQLDVYAYFNNDWEAFAPRNALALRERL
jgi:uncharacterized protein YecE (DUF72 family)